MRLNIRKKLFKSVKISMMIMLVVTIVMTRNILVRKRKIRNIDHLLQLKNAIYIYKKAVKGNKKNVKNKKVMVTK